MDNHRFAAQVRRTRNWSWILGFLLGCVFAPCVGAQEALLPQASPEELGLVLPKAPAQPGNDRRVILGATEEALTVGRIFLEVGDRYVVFLPTGQLVSVPIAETTSTERPFEPLDKRAMAEALTKGRFSDFRWKTTGRYVYIYNCSEAFAMATGRILETLHSSLEDYLDNLKLPRKELEFPLVVIIFRTQEEFNTFRAIPEGIAAYYNVLSNQIVMHEQSRLAEMAPQLAFKQAVSTIAHEGVHQILHNVGIQQRLSNWPVWFSEGLAEFFAPTELSKNAQWKGAGEINDLRVYELVEYYKKFDRPVLDGHVTRRAVYANRLDSLDYAASWAMVHYFAKRKKSDFRAYLTDVSRLRPLESTAPGSLFATHFGTDFGALEQDLAKHLKPFSNVNPIDNQIHFVLMLYGPRREAFVSTSMIEIEKHVNECPRGRKYEVIAFLNRYAAEQAASLFTRN